ncbi:FAD dependent oxidoreductase [Pleurostoma richardsiae]|uniref:FAD dependent oxidoreductase n=1 Tax=Pleurostoma richardsiae TaxID=41990 RepID=A0AA38VRU7_9PEZI|nr:FAD dependent oxidoreductase [Pleurostoma richardsiae]
MSTATESNIPNISRPSGGESPSPLSRSASISLQAAAALNAGLQHESSRRASNTSSQNRHSPQTGRRRSQVLMNLQLNDPSVPSPGEMVGDISAPVSPSARLSTADPHHSRAPSLGELHQELEAEQEAQVNRLLQMIRQQQLQLQQLQTQQGQSSSTAVDDSDRTPPNLPISSPPPVSSPPASSFPGQPSTGSLPRSPVFPIHPRSSFDIARADLQRRSRTPSQHASPRLRSTSISGESGEPLALGGRDESAFYQAETQMLVRENQMLRHRIRDLERQLSELTTGGTSNVTREPAHPSGLHRTSSVTEEDRPAVRPTTVPLELLPPAVETPKEE